MDTTKPIVLSPEAAAADAKSRAAAVSGTGPSYAGNVVNAPSIPSVVSPYTSSSSGTVSGENNLKTALSGLNGGETAYQDLLKQHYVNVSSRQSFLEARRQAEVQGINSGFDLTKNQTVDAQKKETGATSVSLARIGGYLGGSASGTGAMLNLSQTHTNELQNLEVKRQAAVRAANEAVDEKQFALAKEKITEAKSILGEIEASKTNFFNKNLSLLQEERAQDTATGNKYQDELKAFAFVDPSTIDPKKKLEIDKFYGVSGFTDKYLKATSDINKVKSQKDAIAFQKDFIGLLKDIPAGQNVKFPDGTTYTGIGSAGDISTVSSTDSSGVVRQFMINKMTGKLVGTVNLGAVGKPVTSGSNSNVNGELTFAQEALEVMADPKTKKVPVNQYIEAYKAFTLRNPGQGQKFLSQFDPVIYTGKAGSKLKLTTGVQSDGSSDEEEESAVDGE